MAKLSLSGSKSIEKYGKIIRKMDGNSAFWDIFLMKKVLWDEKISEFKS